MKVTRLIIKNIGLIKDETIELNKPLILFFGDIRQGKTTILNAVKWVFGGSFPQDIITHGETEASVVLLFDNGSITREWYVAKDGTTKAREITFIKDGQPVKKPVDEIKQFLNPYLLDNEFLKKMNETDRKKYFADLFAVDTTELDERYSKLDAAAKELRAKLKGYGEIDVTPVETIDAQPIKEELARIRMAYETDLVRTKQHNDAAGERERAVQEKQQRAQWLLDSIQKAQAEIKSIEMWLEENPGFGYYASPPVPDTSELEDQLSQAAANQVRYEQYEKNLSRAAERDKDKTKLATLEKAAKDVKKEKVGKLKEVSATCGVKGLAFDEDGNFIYDKTQAGMLSTSQIMQLSEELSALYPAGFGLDLIDRAESLGTSIFSFVEQAEREEKTILAAIVGIEPAEVPENIGVFVVKNGQITG